MEKYSRAGQAIDDNMAHAHFTLSALGYKNTHLEYVILIAFLPQKWLHERASVLRYMYIACRVSTEIGSIYSCYKNVIVVEGCLTAHLPHEVT